MPVVRCSGALVLLGRLMRQVRVAQRAAFVARRTCAERSVELDPRDVLNLDFVKTVEDVSNLNAAYTDDVERGRGLSPLMICVLQRNMERCLEVLSCGADVGVCDALGRTALHHACTSPELLQLLLDNGGEVHLDVECLPEVLDVARRSSSSSSSSPSSPSSSSSSSNLHDNVAKGVSSTSLPPRTALGLAALAGCLEAVSVLIAHGATLDWDFRAAASRRTMTHVTTVTADRLVAALLHGLDTLLEEGNAKDTYRTGERRESVRGERARERTQSRRTVRTLLFWLEGWTISSDLQWLIAQYL